MWKLLMEAPLIQTQTFIALKGIGAFFDSLIGISPGSAGLLLRTVELTDNKEQHWVNKLYPAVVNQIS